MRFTKSLERDSNIELMRLVCMLMILVHHLITHIIYEPDVILGSKGNIDMLKALAIAFNSLCYVGVNCFMLITGYYGARFKWQGLVKLYIILVFYAIVQTSLKIGMGQIILSLGAVKDCVFVFSQFSKSNWWFMNCYVIFYMLTPLICLDSFTKKTFHQVIILLLIVNVYLGYWWNDYTSGYSVAQFVFLYVIGGYIKRFVDIYSFSRIKCFSVYLISSFLFSFIIILSHYCDIPHWRAMPYNNPLIVISALGFFCFFLKLSFANSIVNTLAESAISIYLLQNFDVFRYIFFEIENRFSQINVVICYVAFIFVFCIVAIGVDQVRRFMSKNVMALVNSISTKLTC